MITPAYAPTATERVLPRLALDFTTGTLDPRVTMTRALNTATRVNSSGLIELVNADLPRFDFNLGVGGACKGLLIEETRQNSFINSIFSGATSGAPGATPTGWGATVVGSGANTVVSQDDEAVFSSNCVQITIDSSSRYFYGQTFSVAANTTYVVSCVVDVVLAGVILLHITFGASPSGSTITYQIDGSTVSSSTVIPVGRHTIACVLSVGATAGNASVRIGCGTVNIVSGGANVTFRRPQWETGAFATSYIPTTTTSLTRNADVVTMTGTNFSDWWRPSRGTMVVRGRQMVTTGTRPWVYINDGTADNAISLRGNGVNPELFVKATTDQVQIDMGTLAANTSQRLAGAWATNDCAASLDGGTPVVDTSAAIPTVDRMLIGSDGTNYLNGWIERIEFFDGRLIAPELQVAASQFGYRSIVGPVIYSTTIR